MSIVNTTNLYLATAEAQWKSGEDGEVIARELAHALKHVIVTGHAHYIEHGSSMPDSEILREFARLMNE